jgi:uncharacterized protein YbjT (DUF2867 family)
VFREYDVPTTFLRTTFFFEGFAGGVGPTRAGDGTLVLTLPMADQPLSGIAVADIGKTALSIFKRGADLIGETVSIAGDHLTGAQYASAFSDAFGEAVTYRPMSWDDFRAQGFPGAVEMGNMFQYYAQNSARFVGDRDLAAVRELNPALSRLARRGGASNPLSQFRNRPVNRRRSPARGGVPRRRLRLDAADD